MSKKNARASKQKLCWARKKFCVFLKTYIPPPPTAHTHTRATPHVSFPTLSTNDLREHMEESNRGGLTSSVVMASGTSYDSASESNSSDDSDADLKEALANAYKACASDAPRSFFDNDTDDDVPEQLLSDDDGDDNPIPTVADTHAFDQMLTSGVGGDDGDDDDLLASMQSLALTPPKLENTMISVVVQFWDDGENGVPKFVAETDELYVPHDAMQSFCTTMRDAPFRMRLDVMPKSADADADALADIAELSDEEADKPELSDDEADEPELKDEPEFADDTVPPYGWIPARGYVNVLAMLYAQAPVIVGLLTERYDLTDASASVPYIGDDELRDAFNGNGKRIQWLDGALGATKRSRVTEAGTGADKAKDTTGKEEAPSDDIMRIAMTNISTPTVSSEWTTHTNGDTIVCGFERNDTTGVVMHARVALGLHALGLRHELQTALDNSRNTM